MNRAKLLLLSSLLALGGCEVASKGPPTAAAPAPAATVPVATVPAAAAPVSSAAPAAAGVACPSQDFEVFLKAFADDIEVQKAYTQRPLRSDSIDPDASPEPRPVSAMLDGDALRFPVMPSTRQQQSDGLALSLSETNGDKEVMLAKPDTDYQLSFFFRKGECWTLYRKRDDSL